MKFILLDKQNFSELSLSMHTFDTISIGLQSIAGVSISEMENKKKIIKTFREANNSLQKLVLVFKKIKNFNGAKCYSSCSSSKK